MQGLNGLKYFSTIVAVTTRTKYFSTIVTTTAFTRNRSIEWRIIAWIASGIAAVASTYWDLVLDWGLNVILRTVG